MTGRQTAVSAVLLVQPRPLNLSLPRPCQEENQWSLSHLELLVRGAAGRDVWIFSVSVVSGETGNTVSGLTVIKVTKMARNPGGSGNGIKIYFL